MRRPNSGLRNRINCSNCGTMTSQAYGGACMKRNQHVSWWASNPLGACQVTLHFNFEHLLQSCLCLCCMLHQCIHYRKRIVLHETGETQKQFANTVSCCTFPFRLDIKVACDQPSWNATMQNDQTHYTFYDLMIEKLSMSDRSCASLSPSQA